jgi:hypothetical protein
LKLLHAKNNSEYETLRENLIKKHMNTVKNEKIKYEDKLREINYDNCLLSNTLQIEKDFLQEKINVSI